MDTRSGENKTEGLSTVKVIILMLKNKERYTDATIVGKHQYFRKLDHTQSMLMDLYSACHTYRPHLIPQLYGLSLLKF